MRSNEFVPAEVELFKEIADLKEKLKSAPEGERPRLTRELNEKSLALRLALDRSRRRA